MSDHTPNLENLIKHKRQKLSPKKCNLQLWIHRARVTDSSKPSEDQRIYSAYAWVVPDASGEYYTGAKIGSPDPKWDSKCMIPMGFYEQYKFLNLEVCREFCKSDPGTSTRRALIGRSCIRLPMFGKWVITKAPLVRLDREDGMSVCEGFIHVMMRIVPETHEFARR